MVDRLDLLAGLVLDSGRLWGDSAAGFQWEDAKAILGGREPPFHFLTRARGGSKTTDLAAMAAVLLLTTERAQLDWLAADSDQGALAIDAIAGFVFRTPFLSGALDVQSRRVVCRETGSSLTVLAADAPGAWGRTPRAAFVDELAQWGTTSGPKRLWEAMSSAVAKREDSQLVVLTTAGSLGHWSHGILKHAERDPLWRVHEVPGPPPWMDESRLEEQKRRLPESSFRRLFLNEWTAPEDRLTTLDDLEACVVLEGPLEPRKGHRYVIGLDIGLKHDRTVAAVCHREEDRVVLDRMEVWAGTRKNPVQIGVVEEWLLEAHRQFNRARLVLDPWQAVSTAQRLRAAGVSVKEFTFSASSNAELALTLYRLLRERNLALPDDKELLAELANVRLRETSPSVYRLDHDEGQHDDRAVALALAAFDLTQAPAEIDHEALALALGVANESLAQESPVMGSANARAWRDFRRGP